MHPICLLITKHADEQKVVVMTYPSSIEYVEQDDKNDRANEEEDCEAK